MIYLSSDGKVINTDDLLQRGLSGNPQMPQVTTPTLDIPNLTQQTVPQTAPQQVTSAVPQTSPVADPTKGTYADLVGSKEFQLSDYVGKRQLFDSWAKGVTSSIASSGLRGEEQMAVLNFIKNKYNTEYPELETSWLDPAVRLTSGLVSSAGDMMAGVSRLDSMLGADPAAKTELDTALQLDNAAKHIQDNWLSPGARDQLEKSQLRQDQADGQIAQTGEMIQRFVDSPVDTTAATAAGMAPAAAAGLVHPVLGAIVAATQGLGGGYKQRYNNILNYYTEQNAINGTGFTEEQLKDEAYRIASQPDVVADLLSAGGETLEMFPVFKAFSILSKPASGVAGSVVGNVAREVAKDAVVSGTGGVLSNIGGNMGNPDPTSSIWDGALPAFVGEAAAGAPFSAASGVARSRGEHTPPSSEDQTEQPPTDQSPVADSEAAKRAQEREDAQERHEDFAATYQPVQEAIDDLQGSRTQSSVPVQEEVITAESALNSDKDLNDAINTTTDTTSDSGSSISTAGAESATTTQATSNTSADTGTGNLGTNQNEGDAVQSERPVTTQDGTSTVATTSDATIPTSTEQGGLQQPDQTIAEPTSPESASSGSINPTSPESTGSTGQQATNSGNTVESQQTLIPRTGLTEEQNVIYTSPKYATTFKLLENQDDATIASVVDDIATNGEKNLTYSIREGDANSAIGVNPIPREGDAPDTSISIIHPSQISNATKIFYAADKAIKTGSLTAQRLFLSPKLVVRNLIGKNIASTSRTNVDSVFNSTGTGKILSDIRGQITDFWRTGHIDPVYAQWLKTAPAEFFKYPNDVLERLYKEFVNLDGDVADYYAKSGNVFSCTRSCRHLFKLT
ncbi:hypothetical protein, partial [Pelistega indica]|uniref:hypothetical protein n=1 Tax=Pelistega indica TaxID=1414851 RepID=UPI00055F0239